MGLLPTHKGLVPSRSGLEPARSCDDGGECDTMVATFEWAKTTGCTFQFIDQSTPSTDANIILWSWDFGDGTFSMSQHPVHTFTSYGAYTVKLTVTDDAGCSKTTERTVYCCDVEAKFYMGCPSGLTVTFYSDSTGPIFKHIWDFGDGSGDFFGAEVTHTFPSSGIYLVKLRVESSGDGCYDEISVPVDVQASICCPTPDSDGVNRVYPAHYLVTFIGGMSDGPGFDLCKPELTGNPTVHCGDVGPWEYSTGTASGVLVVGHNGCGKLGPQCDTGGNLVHLMQTGAYIYCHNPADRGDIDGVIPAVYWDELKLSTRTQISGSACGVCFATYRGIISPTVTSVLNYVNLEFGACPPDDDSFCSRPSAVAFTPIYEM